MGRAGGYLFCSWLCRNLLWRSLSAVVASQLLSYTAGQTYYYGGGDISKRLRFTGDPKMGDASIAIANVRLSDTATYECKVKKAPGVDTRKVTVVVMGEEEFLYTGFTCSFSQPSLGLLLNVADIQKECLRSVVFFSYHCDHTFLCSYTQTCPITSPEPEHWHYTLRKKEVFVCHVFLYFLSLVPPSKPKCWVEGGEERGGTVSLRCKSSKGSTPLTYTWSRETGAIPTTATHSEEAT